MADERIVVVPLRREWQKVPRWRRAKKAARAVKEFILRHAKVKEVKIGKWANELLWQRGATNPPAKITLRVSKDKDIAKAELATLPQKAKRHADKEKIKTEDKKKKEEAKKAKEEERKKEDEFKKKKEEEKKQLEEAKKYQAKVSKEQEMAMHR